MNPERTQNLQINSQPMPDEITKRTPNNSTDIQTITPEVNSPIVMPVVSAQEALTAWNAYLDLKKQIVETNDIQVIAGKQFLKKSYWRKIATFFNLTVDLVNESHEELNGELIWNFACKATAPNGRSAIGTGSCSAFEKATIVNGKPMQKGKVLEWGKNSNGKSFPVKWEWETAQPNSIHNVRTTAETRAWNRAVSNLVGGGEVSAEEVAQSEVIYEPTPKPATPPEQAKQPLQGPISQPQIAKIFVLLKEKGVTEERLKEKYGVAHMNDLTKDQASKIIEQLINYRK